MSYKWANTMSTETCEAVMRKPQCCPDCEHEGFIESTDYGIRALVLQYFCEHCPTRWIQAYTLTDARRTNPAD